MDYHYTDDYGRYRRSEYRRGYRDGWSDFEPKRHPLRRSRNGMLLGVCQGFADWLEIPAWPLRLGMVIAFFASGFWPVGGLYLVAAIAMKPEGHS